MLSRAQVNMSVAIIPLAKEFDWSASDKGLVGSAFFWGYTLTQIPGGLLAKSLGGATVRLARPHSAKSTASVLQFRLL